MFIFSSRWTGDSFQASLIALPATSRVLRTRRISPFLRGLTMWTSTASPISAVPSARTAAITVSYGLQGEYAGQFPWNSRFVKDVGKILGVSYIPSVTSDDRTELMQRAHRALWP